MLGDYYVDANGNVAKTPIKVPWYERVIQGLAGAAAGYQDPGYAARMLNDKRTQLTSALNEGQRRAADRTFTADQSGLDRGLRRELQGNQQDFYGRENALERDERVTGRREGFANQADILGKQFGYNQQLAQTSALNDLALKKIDLAANQPLRDSSVLENNARAKLYGQQAGTAEQLTKIATPDDIARIFSALPPTLGKAMADTYIAQINRGIPVTVGEVVENAQLAQKQIPQGQALPPWMMQAPQQQGGGGILGAIQRGLRGIGTRPTSALPGGPAQRPQNIQLE